MKNKLWVLQPQQDLPDSNNPWKPWYDKAFGFVVCAETETRARELASSKAGAESSYFDENSGLIKFDATPWMDPSLSVCEELIPTEGEHLIMRDFAKA